MTYLSFFMLIASVSVALVTQSWPAAVVALTSIANAAFEQWHYNESGKDDVQNERITELDTKFRSLRADFQQLVSLHTDILKQSEEVRRIIQQHNLKQTFGPKV